MPVVARAVRLAPIRKSHALTRRQLADRLGFSEDEIAGLESGQIMAGAQLRLMLMRYFDCQFHDLFELVSVELASEHDARPDI